MDASTSVILNSLTQAANGEVTEQDNTELAQVNVEESVDEVLQEAVEPKVEEVKKEEPKEDLFSKRFAALSKKERILRKREADLTSKMAALEEKMKAFEAPKAEPVREPLEYRLRREPLKALEEAGLPYEKLTQLVLNDGKLSTESQMELMREELDNKYKSEIETLRKEIQDKEVKKQQEYEKQVVENFKVELNTFVDSSEEYELIRVNSAVDTVFAVIEEHYNKTGKVLSNKEAADAVESHLETIEKEKFLKSKKLSKLLQPKLEAKEPHKKPENKVNEPSLSNSHSATLSRGTGKKLLSDDDSKLQAASMIRWDD